MARSSFRDAFRPPKPNYERTRRASDTQKWAQLRRVQGNNCALPIIDFWHRLLVIRVSEVLRFIQRGGHLATRHGRGPMDSSKLASFVSNSWWESRTLQSEFGLEEWEGPLSDVIQMCCTVAAVLRLLDDRSRIATANDAIHLALGLSIFFDSNEEEVDQESKRLADWAGSF